jgi:hypothetical protein
MLSRNQIMGVVFCVVFGTLCILSVMRVDVVAGSSASPHRKLQAVQDVCASGGELRTEELKPRMTAAEVDLFNKYLNKAQYYFETGEVPESQVAMLVGHF